MDRLLDSFKEANNHAYITFNIFLIILVALIVVAISGYSYLLQAGKASYSQLYSLFSAPAFIKSEYIIISLTILVVCVIVLMLIRSQSKDSELNLNAEQSIIPRHKTFWRPTSSDQQNLVVSSEQWEPDFCEVAAYGIEVVLFNTRTESSTNPYRHLFHRGSNDLGSGSPGSDTVGSGGLSDGLPSEMAPGVFVDRHTNDIIVFVDTDPDPVNGTVVDKFAYRESIRINDLPLNIPFYLHLILNDRVLEVYVNCRLAGTKILHGSPRHLTNQYFGRTGFAPARALIQNLTLWDGTINTFDLMKMCNKKIYIKKETWDLAISGKLPTFGFSQCGEVSVNSKPFSTTLTIPEATIFS